MLTRPLNAAAVEAAAAVTAVVAVDTAANRVADIAEEATAVAVEVTAEAEAEEEGMASSSRVIMAAVTVRNSLAQSGLQPLRLTL